MATKIETINKRLEVIVAGILAATAKLEVLNAEKAKLEADRDEAAVSSERDAALFNGLPHGTDVTFTYGRAESKRTLSGIVKASKATDVGRQYKIEVGEGFDSELYTVMASAISVFAVPTDVQPVPVGNAAEENR